MGGGVGRVRAGEVGALAGLPPATPTPPALPRTYLQIIQFIERDLVVVQWMGLVVLLMQVRKGAGGARGGPLLPPALPPRHTALSASFFSKLRS